MTDQEKKVLADRKAKQEEQFAKVLNPAAFVGVTKEEFMEQYKGKLTFDRAQAWKWIVSKRPKKAKED